MISDSVVLGKDVVIPQSDLVNLYGCTIGDGTKIGAFVEIQKNAFIGTKCKISSHTFVCEGVTIKDHVFIGHGVMFINDKIPRAVSDEQLQTEEDWDVVPTLVKKGATVGSGAVIMCGVTIGKNAMVGAGAVVTRDVPDNAVVAGIPAGSLRSNHTGPEGNGQQRRNSDDQCWRYWMWLLGPAVRWELC